MTRLGSRLLVTVPSWVVLAECATGCSALLDWNSFTGSLDGGGVDAAIETSVLDAAGDGTDAHQPDAMVVPCSGGSCAPSAPAGWMGPVALFVGTSAAPSCGSETVEFDGHGDLVAPDATCSTCSCGAPTGETCAGPVLSLFVNPGCTQTPPPPASATVTVSASCTPIFAAAATLATPLPSGGTCAPAGGAVVSVAPPTWGTTARACSIHGSGTCAGGSLCVPAQPPSTSVCIMQSGMAASCPAGYQASSPQVFYMDVADSRGCGACTCGSPSGASCSIGSPAVNGYMSGGCSGSAVVSLSAPSACTVLNGALLVQLASGAPTLGGTSTCAVSGGGKPSGAATPTGATSFCCAN